MNASSTPICNHDAPLLAQRASSSLKEITKLGNTNRRYEKMKQSYKPNWNDPRVINRARHAYGFSRGVMTTTKPSHWAKSVIDKYFGTQNHDLSKYLRSILLITTNNNYDKATGLTKQYLLNERGIEFLRSIFINKDTEFAHWAQDNNHNIDENNSANTSPSVALLYDQYVVSKFCEREYGMEMKSLDFQYQDKASRLWHPIQNIKREYKSHIMTEMGLVNQYDIESCAPTLLLQYAQHLGMDEYLFAVNDYLKNKTEIRNKLAQEMEVEPKVIKVIINALFCGARIGNSPEFAISHLLNNDLAKITFLKENEFIQELRKDIKLIWSYIETTLPVIITTTKSGKTRKLPLNSKRRWAVYFQLERQVLNQVREYLKSTGNKHFLEHDGWNTQQEVNQQELIDFVKNKTGFQISIKQEKLDKNHTTNTSPSVALLLDKLQDDTRYWDNNSFRSLNISPDTILLLKRLKNKVSRSQK